MLLRREEAQQQTLLYPWETIADQKSDPGRSERIILFLAIKSRPVGFPNRAIGLPAPLPAHVLSHEVGRGHSAFFGVFFKNLSQGGKSRSKRVLDLNDPLVQFFQFLDGQRYIPFPTSISRPIILRRTRVLNRRPQKTAPPHGCSGLCSAPFL